MRRFGFAKLMLWLGLLFIYLPMIIMVIYSFNASKLVTVWGGWSLKWYFGLLDNKQLIGSVFRSLEIAFYTAIAAVALGTVAAFVLTRIPRFRGRTLFGGMVTAPLVMPEVITGLSLLLLFVAMAQLVGWPAERGMLTIWIAHTTFCTAYVAIVVSARLRELDLSIEEAAMDLGADSATVFRTIVLPLIRPAFISSLSYTFVRSMTAVSAVIFLISARWYHLTVLIYNFSENLRFGLASVLATALILIVLATFGLLRLLVPRNVHLTKTLGR